MSHKLVPPNPQWVKHVLEARYPTESPQEINARMQNIFKHVLTINAQPNPRLAFEISNLISFISLMRDSSSEAAYLRALYPMVKEKLLAMEQRGASEADMNRYLENATRDYVTPGAYPCARMECVAVGVKKCSACKKAFYCSQACQIACWPEHKKVCVISRQSYATHQ